MLKTTTKNHQRCDSKTSQYSKNSGYNPLGVTYKESHDNRNRINNHMISTESRKISNRNPNVSRDHSTDFGKASSYTELQNTPQSNKRPSFNQVASEFKANNNNLCGFPGFNRNSCTEKKFDIQTYINDKKQRLQTNQSYNDITSMPSSKRVGQRDSTAANTYN